MRIAIRTAFAVAMGLFVPLAGLSAQNVSPMLNYCWADGIIYGLIIPSNVKASNGLRNDLYVFHNLNGQRPVAEAGPDDANFQNGRFVLANVEFTPAGINALDPDKDGMCEFEITSAQMVQNYIKMGYLKITGRGSIVDVKLVSPELYKDEVK